MAIDYDVVIIGGTLAARYVALNGVQQRANIALVEPRLNISNIYHHAIREITKQNLDIENREDFDSAMLYAQSVAAQIDDQLSPTILAAAGVDVILGEGQFQAYPKSSYKLAFSVNERFLVSRSYLLATGSRPGIPFIEGLQATGYVTLSNIWQFLSQIIPQDKLPKNWVIIGGLAQSIEVAQTLRKFGCEVALIVEGSYILPYIDPEIAILLQAQLEVEGVRIFTETSVTQVMQIDGKKWIQAGDKAIETDEILVATQIQPNIDNLNLPAVGVKWHEYGLVVNHKLQTTNRHIYACGEILGGYNFLNLANYEAKIAIHNALFFSTKKVNYRSIPWALFTEPALAQVGLTERQALRRYGNEVLILKQYYKSIPAAQISSNITGICKLIVLRNGEILGGAIFGEKAEELINIIAFAIAHKIKVKHLESLASAHPGYTEILELTARKWEKQRLTNFDLQEFLDDFFLLRRSWRI